MRERFGSSGAYRFPGKRTTRKTYIIPLGGGNQREMVAWPNVQRLFSWMSMNARIASCDTRDFSYFLEAILMSIVEALG